MKSRKIWKIEPKILSEKISLVSMLPAYHLREAMVLKVQKQITVH